MGADDQAKTVPTCVACQVGLVKKSYGWKCPKCGLETK